MIWKIFLLIFPLFLIIVPILFYRKHTPMLRKFYIAMMCDRRSRMLYTRLLAVLILVYHFVYINATGDVKEVALSTFVCALMFTHRNSERVLDYLHTYRRFKVAAVVTLVLAFIPYCFPLAVTFGLLLLGTIFYPHYSARKTLVEMSTPDEEIINTYYKL